MHGLRRHQARLPCYSGWTGMSSKLPKIYHKTINFKNVGSAATSVIVIYFTGCQEFSFPSFSFTACGWTEIVLRVDGFRRRPQRLLTKSLHVSHTYVRRRNLLTCVTVLYSFFMFVSRVRAFDVFGYREGFLCFLFLLSLIRFLFLSCLSLSAKQLPQNMKRTSYPHIVGLRRCRHSTVAHAAILATSSPSETPKHLDCSVLPYLAICVIVRDFWTSWLLSLAEFFCTSLAC